MIQRKIKRFFLCMENVGENGLKEKYIVTMFIRVEIDYNKHNLRYFIIEVFTRNAHNDINK